VIRTCYSSVLFSGTRMARGHRQATGLSPYRGRSAMIHLLIAVALGIALAVGGAFAASNTLTSVTNGAPAKASLYQYGNR